MSTDTLLADRGSRYGLFIEQTRIISGLVGVMRQNGLDELETDQQEALHQIAVKISRILNGDADYVDNWDDIGGYSGLVAKRLRGDEI